METASFLLFQDRPVCSALFEALQPILSSLGPIRIEEKKTSLHIVAGRAAFLGVHPRRDGLRLNLVLNRKLESPRVVRSEQVSKSSFHNEVDLRSPADLDSELLAWLSEAFLRVTS